MNLSNKFQKTRIAVIIQTTLLLILIAITLPYNAGKSLKIAVAETAYLRVVTKNVMFCASPTSNDVVFELPYSYYVKKTGETGAFYQIECYGESPYTPLLDGYVLKTDVVTESTDKPYLNLTVTTATSAILYEDKELTTPIQYVFKNRTLGYYGAYKVGSTYAYCVTYNDKIGYVRESELIPFDVPLHETPIKLEPTTPSDTPDTGSSTTSDNTLKIIVIVALAVGAFIIFALIVIPEQKEKRYDTE